MDQCFVLADLDGRVAVSLETLGGGIWDLSLHALLLSSPFKYLKPLEEIRRDCFACLPALHPQKQSRLLALLPCDVLRLVFESLGQPMAETMYTGVQVASFALTCQLCFEAGHPVLKNHQAAKKDTWTGHRIIIAGEYQRTDDLPDSLNDDPSMKQPEINIFGVTEGSWPCAYKDLRDTVDEIGGLFDRMNGKHLKRKKVMEVCNFAKLWGSMFGLQWRSRIVTIKPVLRNLTVKEYARGEALEKAQDSGEALEMAQGRRDPMETFKDLRIGDLANFRIVWSSDPSVSMEADDAIVRGQWAGHRFDIVSQSDVDLEGWKDVSDELIGEVTEIYKDNNRYY